MCMVEPAIGKIFSLKLEGETYHAYLHHSMQRSICRANKMIVVA